MYSGRWMLKSVPPPGGVPVTNATAGLILLALEVFEQDAGVEVLMLFSAQLGSLKYGPTPLEVPSLSRPWNRLSLPPDIGSKAFAALAPCAAIAVGSFSSAVTTHGPRVGLPI